MPLPRRLENETALHVAVPAPATAPVGKGIRGHSYRVVDRELSSIGGVQLSNPARAWCELSGVLTLDELIIAGDHILLKERKLSSFVELVDQASRFPAPRGRALRALALPDMTDTSESPQETRLRLIVKRAGIPGLVANLAIRTSGGFDYRGDIVFPRRKLIIEYQSGFHDSPRKRREDMTRRSRLEADGWTVMEVNSDDLKDAFELCARIRLFLAS